jgi:hypothetical protein
MTMAMRKGSIYDYQRALDWQHLYCSCSTQAIRRAVVLNGTCLTNLITKTINRGHWTYYRSIHWLSLLNAQANLYLSIGSRFEDAASAIQRVWPATSAAHQALAKDIGIHGVFGATIGRSLNQLLQHLQVVRVSQYSSQEPNQNAYNLINLQIIPDRQSYCQYLP